MQRAIVTLHGQRIVIASLPDTVTISTGDTKGDLVLHVEFEDSVWDQLVKDQRAAARRKRTTSFGAYKYIDVEHRELGVREIFLNLNEIGTVY